MRLTARHTILFIFILICMLPAGSRALQPNMMLGATADGTTSAILPCTSAGFSVERTLTLTGFLDARMLRVNATTRAGNGGIGYVVGGNGDLAQIWLAAFDMDTLGLLGTYIIQPAGGAAFGPYSNNGRYVGVTRGNDLFVFVQNRQLGFGGSCTIAGRCASLLNFTGTTFNGVGTDTATELSTIDDGKFISDSTILITDASATGFRKATLWSASSLTKLGSGAPIGSSGFTLLSRSVGGYNYMAVAGATPNMYRLPVGSTTFDATTTVTYGGGRIAEAIFAFNNDTGLIATETNYNGGFLGLRNFMTAPGMIDGGNAATYVVGDQSAAYQSTFWDSINSKVYTVRADGGAGLSTNIIRTNALAAIEQRFSCGTCVVNGSQGMQMADFNENMARLYLVNNANPPVVNKIKVCATGGP